MTSAAPYPSPPPILSSSPHHLPRPLQTLQHFVPLPPTPTPSRLGMTPPQGPLALHRSTPPLPFSPHSLALQPHLPWPPPSMDRPLRKTGTFSFRAAPLLADIVPPRQASGRSSDALRNVPTVRGAGDLATHSRIHTLRVAQLRALSCFRVERGGAGERRDGAQSPLRQPRQLREDAQCLGSAVDCRAGPLSR